MSTPTRKTISTCWMFERLIYCSYVFWPKVKKMRGIKICNSNYDCSIFNVVVYWPFPSCLLPTTRQYDLKLHVFTFSWLWHFYQLPLLYMWEIQWNTSENSATPITMAAKPGKIEQEEKRKRKHRNIQRLFKRG